ncbi:MAG: tetratricopeptide repeat protein [Haliea sp.]|jgi:tetratricopeptide (TPR) repeat protein|nr:tetratricopeptide repeat protein [Haliea sp.]
MANRMAESTSDIQTAARHAMKLLGKGETRPALEQAQEVLRLYPDEINCQFVVAAAQRALGEKELALKNLKVIVDRVPEFAVAQQELGFAHADAGNTDLAIDALKTAVKRESRLAGSWKLLGELLLARGEEEAAADAFNQSALVSADNPRLGEAIKLFRAGRLGQAEQLCREILMDQPTDVNTIRLLAEIGVKVGVYDDAQKLLERCLELAPDFDLARLNYANVLSQRNKLAEALAQANLMLEREPDKQALLGLKAQVLQKMSEFEQALPIYNRLLTEFTPQPGIALAYGHALKTIGDQETAIAAYRQAAELRPGFGDAWWSLANLKTFRFEDDDIAAMRREMLAQNNSLEDRYHLSFALGKALELREEFEDSFKFYDLGNRAKVRLEGYSADENHNEVQRTIHTCTSDVVTAPSGGGCPAPDPIFIVGLPRSGSTLLEQILASHSQVDGTKELPDLLGIARRLGGKRRKSETSLYPAILADLSDEQFRELGEEYLQRTRIQRGDAPFFIDKMPNNFFHVGLISRMLPNATIIDARRHPMAACFSGFTQLFARGQSFTYGLENIGRYYRDYVALMDHWDKVLPGKVHLALYEEVVNDTENQVRRLLAHCGLPFEHACLEFYQTQRPVRTASSEQVRQPIYSSGLEHWRHYEVFLDPLKDALGPVMDRFPETK